VEDLFATLAEGKLFTKLDMSQAYQQLLLNEDSKEYDTITLGSTGATEEERLANLEQLLKRFSDAGLRLKRSKCQFLRQSVTYPGHKIIADSWICLLEDKGRAIKEAPSPKNSGRFWAW
jgi:hypothetical protein